jgi:hypothetical protein
MSANGFAKLGISGIPPLTKEEEAMFEKYVDESVYDGAAGQSHREGVTRESSRGIPLDEDAHRFCSIPRKSCCGQ